MTPTRPATLLGMVVGFALLSYLLVALAYRSLPQLPAFAPISLVMLAVAELGIAKVIRDRLARRRPAGGRVLHPIQIARAAALAKASSTAAAVLLGGYAGVLAWTLPRRDQLLGADQDALIAGLSSLACLFLVVAALVLERAGRVPDGPRLGSPS